MNAEQDEGGKDFAAPGEIVFSLPTICEWMPPMTEKTSQTGEGLQLHEDDWRQAELIALDYRNEIEAMLSSIYDIYQKARSPMGAFLEIHVRNKIADPLGVRSITADSFRMRFHNVIDYDSLEYESFEGCVQGGFAWRTEGGLLVYGRQAGSFLHTLCIEILRRGPELEADGCNMEEFCAAHRLILVDWCMCEALVPGDELFREYFLPSGHGYRSIARRH